MCEFEYLNTKYRLSFELTNMSNMNTAIELTIWYRSTHSSIHVPNIIYDSITAYDSELHDIQHLAFINYHHKIYDSIMSHYYNLYILYIQSSTTNGNSNLACNSNYLHFNSSPTRDYASHLIQYKYFHVFTLVANEHTT